MSIVAAFDRTLFCNPTSKFCVVRLKTADPMIPEEARDRYKFSDHLIRFVAVGYDLPQPDQVTVDFDGRYASYPLESLGELELAYATTIHKSQGSEYDIVIIPMLTAHKILLSRNLFYTAITRAKKRVILVGHRKAMYMAINRCRNGRRNTLLGERITLYHQALTRKSVSVPVPTNGETELKYAS